MYAGRARTQMQGRIQDSVERCERGETPNWLRKTLEKCEVELPLMDQKGTLKKAVYGEIMEMLNRRAAMWPAGEVLLKETGRGGRR